MKYGKTMDSTGGLFYFFCRHRIHAVQYGSFNERRIGVSVLIRLQHGFLLTSNIVPSIVMTIQGELPLLPFVKSSITPVFS